MGIKHSVRRGAAWLAALAIALACLAPSLSHALAAATGNKALLMEVCSTTRTRWIAVNDLAPQPVPSSSDKNSLHLAHCPFCLVHAPAVLPSSTTLLSVPAVLVMPLLPTLFLQAPRRPFIWTVAQSRAPPAAI